MTSCDPLVLGNILYNVGIMSIHLVVKNTIRRDNACLVRRDPKIILNLREAFLIFFFASLR